MFGSEEDDDAGDGIPLGEALDEGDDRLPGKDVDEGGDRSLEDGDNGDGDNGGGAAETSGQHKSRT